jgi:Mce-associated membrane protein
MSDYGRPGRKRRIAGQRSGRRPEQPPADEPRSAEILDAEIVEDDIDDAQDQESEATVADPAPDEAGDETDAAEVEPDAGAGLAGERRGRVLIGVLAGLVVVTLALGAVLGQKAWANRQEEQGRNAAVGAANRAATLILSYDYRKLADDFAAARATLTPEFAEKFDQTTKVVGQGATQTKATVEADVREAAVSSSGENVVTVLLFVNQTTTSTITKGKPRVDLNRARFVMVRSGDKWLVQQVDGL